MTVEGIDPIREYVYAGPKDYDFDFKLYNGDELVLKYTNATTSVVTTLVLVTDYTVTLNADQDANPGGTCTVTFDVTIDGGPLAIQRVMPLVQETDWVNGGPFNAQLLEDDLDKIVMMIQDLYYTQHVYDTLHDNLMYIGTWTPSYGYKQLNVVKYNNDYYIANSDFTSGTSFNSANWSLFLDVSGVFTAEANALVAAAAAAASEINAANCAAASAASATTAASEASDSADSATESDNWANYPHNSQVPGYPGEYSAYHWKEEARLIAGDYVPYTGSGTGSAVMPKGTVAQRDGTPATGYLRYNTDYGYNEYYSSSGWLGLTAFTIWSGSTILAKGSTAQRDASPSTGYFRFNSDDNRFEGYLGATPSWWQCVIQDSKTGQMLPSIGTTLQRPGTAVTGGHRHNTTKGIPEFYNGTDWQFLQGYNEVITASKTFWVETTGSDVTGDGSLSSPWATLSHALFYLKGCIAQGDDEITVTIDLETGTYATMTDDITIERIPGLSSLKIQGSGASTYIPYSTAASLTFNDINFSIEYLQFKASEAILDPLITINGCYRAHMIGTHFNDSSFSIAKCVVVNNSYLDIQSLDLQYTNGPALLVHNNSRAYILEVDFYGAAAASGVALTVLDDSKAKLVGGEVTDADIAYGAFSNSQVLVSASNAPTFAGTVTTQYSPAKSAADVTPTWGNANAWIADDA